jgi:hypothetical protein
MTAPLASFTVPETLPPTPAQESAAKDNRKRDKRTAAMTIRAKHLKAEQENRGTRPESFDAVKQPAILLFSL